MSAYPTLQHGPESPGQAPLPGILSPFSVLEGRVEPLPNGTAKLRFGAVCVGVYPSEQRAKEGLQQFRNMRLCT